MDEEWKRTLASHFEGMPVDGWVEMDGRGHTHIEIFAHKLRELNLQEGQFVRIEVISQERLKELGYEHQIS